MVDLWRLYFSEAMQRTEFKELKQDFVVGNFNLEEVFPIEAALIFSMIAYNLMSIFRIFVLQEKTQKSLSTYYDVGHLP